jgi:transcriptional regulator with XRE-family HTH domain
MQRLFRQLKELREAADLSYDEVEQQLVLGPGWIHKFESGDIEPSLGTLAALVHAYGSDLASFFSGFDLGHTNITIDRHLTALEVGQDLALVFPMAHSPPRSPCEARRSTS